MKRDSTQDSDYSNDQSDRHAASTGQAGTASDWLDLHYQAHRSEYEMIARSVGVEAGWYLLDAGCGGGSFLPVLAEQVGPQGAITAMDLAPDNIEMVEKRLASTPIGCPVEAQVGSLTQMPFTDDQFDAIWIANVFMYLDDDEFEHALQECQRVMRPGGLLTIKDADPTLWRIHPAPPTAFIDVTRAVEEAHRDAGGDGPVAAMRARELRRWMERSGFIDVEQRTVPIDRWAPLTDIEHEYFATYFRAFSALSEPLELPEEEKAFWRAQRDPDAAGYVLNDPEFFCGQGDVVATGRAQGSPSV